MSYLALQRARRRRSRVVVVVVMVALAAFLCYESVGTSSSSALSGFRTGHHHLGRADGVVPDGTTVFSDVPAVTRLEPDLLHALRRAATVARADGIQMYVNSGWRSAAYQRELLDEAIAKYGSRSAAAQWVDTPTTSAHVRGEAVDVGHSDATAWLAAHGASYGLCQIYANEPWHYELRPDAVFRGCPAMYADPAADPRAR